MISALVTYYVTLTGKNTGIIECLFYNICTIIINRFEIPQTGIVTILTALLREFGNLLDIVLLLFITYFIVIWIIIRIKYVVYPKISKKHIDNLVDEFWNEIFVAILEVTEKDERLLNNKTFLKNPLYSYEIININSSIRTHKEIIKELNTKHYFETNRRRNNKYETFLMIIDKALVTNTLETVSTLILRIKGQMENNEDLQYQYKEYHKIYTGYNNLIATLKTE